MRLYAGVTLAALALIMLAGCPTQQAQEPALPPEAEVPLPEPTGAVQLTAYINVASGCQDWTVELLKELEEQYDDAVDMEIVDFGKPEGMARMREEGVSCMALLFDGSPVVRIPDEHGGKRTNTFYFPVGFGWTHDDLRETFAAIAAGEAEILSEEEARKELAPEPVEMEVEVNEVDGGAEVLMNGQVALTITQAAGGQSALERAEAAGEAIENWTSEPVHPRQLSIVEAEGGEGWSVLGRGEELVRAYQVDAEAAGIEPPRKCAAQFLDGIRCGIVAAARKGQDPADPSACTPPTE